MYTFRYVRFSENSPKGIFENPQKSRVGRAEILNFRQRGGVSENAKNKEQSIKSRTYRATI